MIRTFVECVILAIAFNRNHPLLLNNNLRSNINHKLQFNNNRNNLKKTTQDKIQAGWCVQDFIGSIASKITATTSETRSSSSPCSLLSSRTSTLMTCFNQQLLSILSSINKTTNMVNGNNSSSNSNKSSNGSFSYPSSSASSAKKTNLFYHHRNAFRRKEDTSEENLQPKIANISTIFEANDADECFFLLLILLYQLICSHNIFVTISLVNSNNFVTTLS